MMKRKRTWASLENELDTKIRAIRAEYERNTLPDDDDTEKPEEGKPTEGGKLASRIPLSTAIIGPTLVGIHLVASPNLVELVSLHAIAEARGSCQSLLSAQSSIVEDPSSNEQIEDTAASSALTWCVDSTWEKPMVWLRQGKTAIEADASCLNHWSQSLLSPESKPTGASLLLVYPRRADNGSDMDDQFVADFQSMFELCGYGLLSASGKFTYDVDVGSWDSSARSVSAALEKWASVREDRPYVILLVWPNEGWLRTRSALAACAEWTRPNVVVHIIPEDLVLMNRRRKSRLIGLAGGIYSMLVKGASVILPDIISSVVASADGGKPPPKRTHIAFTRSKDCRWLICSWCTASGDGLSVKAIPFDFRQQDEEEGTASESYLLKRNETVLRCLQRTSSEPKHTHFVIVTHLLPNDFIDADTLRRSSYSMWSCDSDNPSEFKSTSIMDDGEGNLEIRKELDNLAFLSTVVENPARGQVRAVLLGAFVHGNSGSSQHRRFHSPLHLRCACLLANYIDGILPPAQIALNWGEQQ